MLNSLLWNPYCHSIVRNYKNLGQHTEMKNSKPNLEREDLEFYMSLVGINMILFHENIKGISLGFHSALLFENFNSQTCFAHIYVIFWPIKPVCTISLKSWTKRWISVQTLSIVALDTIRSWLEFSDFKFWSNFQSSILWRLYDSTLIALFLINKQVDFDHTCA